MKWILTAALTCLLGFAAAAQELNRVPGAYLLGSAYAGSYTNRTGETLNAMLTNIASQNADILIDEGIWTIEENVTFPTNVGVIVTPPACFDVQVGVTLTINGPFYAEPRIAFCTVSGVVTGCPQTFHIYDEWGTNLTFDTSCEESQIWDKDSTDDVTTNNISSLYTNLDYIASNDVIEITYTNSDSSTTGFVTRTDSPSGAVVEITFPILAEIPELGFLGVQGFEPKYTNSTTINVTPGAALVCGNFITSSNTINHAVTLGVTEDIMYIFLSCSDASTGGVDIVDSFVEPTYDPESLSWVDVNTNRLIGAIWVTNATIDVFQNSDGWYNYGPAKVIHDVVGNQLGQWVSPTIPLSSVIPTNATMANIRIRAGETNSNSAAIGVTTEELATLNGENPATPTTYSGITAPARSLIGAIDEGDGNDAEAEAHSWIVLGKSREIRYCAEGLGIGIGGSQRDDEAEILVTGWRIDR